MSGTPEETNKTLSPSETKADADKLATDKILDTDRSTVTTVGETSDTGRNSPPSSEDEAQKKMPIFLENPDGSMLEGVPPGYKDPTPPRSPRGLHGQPWVLPVGLDELDGATGITLAEEVDFIYGRHERLLGSLLLVQFLLELAYNFVYVLHSEPSIIEVVTLYRNNITRRTAEVIFWTMFGTQAAYAVGYYCVACYALWVKRPHAYRAFANWCLVGIAAQVFLAYINKFNLLVFFLRLLSYIYAKFLQNLSLSLQLLPQNQNGQNGNNAANLAQDWA